MNEEVGKALAVMAVLYGRSDLNEDAVRMLLSDLSGYPSVAVLEALGKCRKDLRSFPTVADIISRIDDGRPGPEEAWAMVPKGETDSGVWTEEMAQAWGVVRGLYLEDPIAARQAFKESYTRIVKDARNRGVPSTWTPSLGLDKTQHEGALSSAATRGLIGMDHAMALLPGPTGGGEPSDDMTGIATVVQIVLANANTRQKARYHAANLPEVDEAEMERKRELLKHQLKVLEGDV